MIARNQTSSSRFVCIVLAVFVVLCVNERALSQTEHVRLELSIIGAREIETSSQRSCRFGREAMRLVHERPLALRVELRNDSSVSSVVVPRMSPGFRYIRLETRGGGGEWMPVTVREWEESGFVTPQQQALAPGESVVWEFSLEQRIFTERDGRMMRNVERYMFDELGEYELRAFIDTAPPIEFRAVSNVVSVEVVERWGWGWWVAGLGVVAAGVVAWRCRGRFRPV